MEYKKTVVLKYDEKVDIAPKIVAKAAGILSDKIIKIAKENNIPVYKDDTLVDILDRLDIGTTIPEGLYKVVAELFAFLYKIKNKVREDNE